jgi:hypothetical protein
LIGHGQQLLTNFGKSRTRKAIVDAIPQPGDRTNELIRIQFGVAVAKSQFCLSIRHGILKLAVEQTIQ